MVKEYCRNAVKNYFSVIEERKNENKETCICSSCSRDIGIRGLWNNNDSSGSTESDEIVTELSEDTTVTFGMQ